MRCLPFSDRSFGWVLNFFTSFGYFESERENFRVLEEIVRVLEPGGGFLIDLLNVDRALRSLREREVREYPGRRAEIRRWYDPHTRRINKRICLRTPEGSSQTFLESIRAYRPEEVVIGLRWAGLEVGELYGSFEGEGFSDDSERLILVGHKAA
jgi:SAM-dependent methyltransferase